MILLSQNRESAKSQAEKLQRLGCDVRAIADRQGPEAAARLRSHVLLFDGTAFGTEGRAWSAQSTPSDPAMKIIVLASTDCIMEPAYRIRRIFYYAVEPFADNEIADILAAAFQPPPARRCRHTEFAQPLNGIFDHQSQSHARAAGGGAGPAAARGRSGPIAAAQADAAAVPAGKLAQRDARSRPMNLLSLASRCDRVMVLLAQDFGRLPGSLARDTKAEFIALVGAGADKVTTLLVQPSGSEQPAWLRAAPSLDALAEHLVREMATC